MIRSNSPVFDLKKSNRVPLTREYEAIKLTRQQKILISRIVAMHPWRTQRTPHVQRFLENLMQWVAYHDKVAENPKKRVQWNRSYAYYRQYREKGFYPLPTATRERWNAQHRQIVDWLVEIGILTPDQNGYRRPATTEGHKIVGKCLHFRVDFSNPKTVSADPIALLRDLQALNVRKSAIAKMVGVNRSTVSQWYSLSRKPDQKHTIALKGIKIDRQKELTPQA